MSRSPDHLYDLLPVVHRMRDADRGYPLRALLRVINEQVDVIEDDIAQLYENWFIETCEDWVVPYIGDLIGYRPVYEAGDPLRVDSASGRSDKILVPRREVADTVALRRRKGTLALLERLAAAVARWPARAVEFYTLLGWTQHVNHLRPSRGRSVDLRDGDALDLIDGPFDRAAHTVDVRRVVSRRTQGRYDIPSVGVFVWRLQPYSVTHAPACCLEQEGDQCFTFNVLGHDTPLYTKPDAEAEPTHIAEQINLPVPIRRRALEERLAARPPRTRASAVYYGAGRSMVITAPDWPVKDAAQPIPADAVLPADLSEWRHRVARGRIAVDPVLGRMVFPVGQLPKRGVWVTYHCAFSADMGGGEYPRSLSQPAVCTLYHVTKDTSVEGTFETITAALQRWENEKHSAAAADPPDPAAQERLRAAVVEIGDSAVYSEPLTLNLAAGESLQIRAASRTRPVLRLLDYITERPDAFSVSGGRASRFTLDGLVVTGRGIRISGPDPTDEETVAAGDLCDVRIRHCTLVPGWGLKCDCEPKRPNEPSIELVNTSSRIIIDRSIIGSIQVAADEVMTDPVEIEIADSIVDATSLERTAIGAANLPLAFARLSITRCTVFGEVGVHAMALAENTIFMSPVRVARRQQGCVRFCYLTPVSRTPRRYHCQPDLARQAVDDWDPPVPLDQRPAAKALEEERVRPRFNSTRYGSPAYGQLADGCADEITRGADDESEMGAFHDLFQPQRTANLRARLDEFTPAGFEAGILFAS